MKAFSALPAPCPDVPCPGEQEQLGLPEPFPAVLPAWGQGWGQGWVAAPAAHCSHAGAMC